MASGRWSRFWRTYKPILSSNRCYATIAVPSTAVLTFALRSAYHDVYFMVCSAVVIKYRLSSNVELAAASGYAQGAWETAANVHESSGSTTQDQGVAYMGYVQGRRI
jgi:hypothetical protein